MATALALTVTAVGGAPSQAQAASQSTDNGISGPADPSKDRASAAVAVTLGSGWQEFSFISVGVAARGCSPTDPGAPACTAGVGTSFAGTPPWTFTGPATLTVTDAFASGDVFQIFDNSILIGTTSAATIGQNCNNNPDTCQITTGVSSGVFTLGAGNHSITITPQSIAGGAFGGVGFFRVDSTGTGTGCSLTQTVTRLGSTLTLSYTGSTTVASTFSLYLISGTTASAIITAPLPALLTPISTSFTVPNFPAIGNVAWFATFTTPTGGIICSDLDIIQTS